MTVATKTAASLIARGTSIAAFTQLTGCSVTRSGTTATLTKTSHGLSNADHALIQAFALEEFNGIFDVANSAANTFDYTIKQDPGANPSGTTGTIIKGVRSSVLDLSTALGGGMIQGGVMNGNTGPTLGCQLWLGTASADNLPDYLWRQMATFQVGANAWSPFSIPIDRSVKYARIFLGGNTAQAVDAFAEGFAYASAA